MLSHNSIACLVKFEKLFALSSQKLFILAVDLFIFYQHEYVIENNDYYQLQYLLLDIA